MDANQVRPMLPLSMASINAQACQWKMSNFPKACIAPIMTPGSALAQTRDESSALNLEQRGFAFASKRTGVTHIYDDAGRREAFLLEKNLAAAQAALETKTSVGLIETNTNEKRKKHRGRPKKLLEPSDTVKRIFRGLNAENAIPLYQKLHTNTMRSMQQRKRPKLILPPPPPSDSKEEKVIALDVTTHETVMRNKVEYVPNCIINHDYGEKSNQDTSTASPHLITKLVRRAVDSPEWMVMHSTN